MSLKQYNDQARTQREVKRRKLVTLTAIDVGTSFIKNVTQLFLTPALTLPWLRPFIAARTTLAKNSHTKADYCEYAAQIFPFIQTQTGA